MAVVHEGIAPLAFLLGAWAGDGRGWYPTIADFGYHEEIEFSHSGKPFLAYRQRTWAADDGRPLHGETGYWRLAGSEIELVVAHPTGVVEVAGGTLVVRGDERATELRSSLVATTPSAKSVTAIIRRLTVTGDRLEYELDMGAVGQPVQSHLRAHLNRL